MQENVLDDIQNTLQDELKEWKDAEGNFDARLVPPAYRWRALELMTQIQQARALETIALVLFTWMKEQEL